MKEDDPLEDFARREITLDGVAKRVYVAGSGRAVIVMTEMPGISPHVARFARWVRDARFTVYMPSLFGRDGGVPGAEEGAAVFERACVSAEFRAMAANQSKPVLRGRQVLQGRAPRSVPPQCRDRPPDRRSRPADHRRPNEILSFFARRLVPPV